MKSKFLFLGLAVFLLFSCSPTKVVRSTQKGLKGNWILSSITTDQGNLVNIKELFNQASPDCFEGSKWNFVNNNNSGTYTFQNAGCNASANSIKWFMEENGDEVNFLWKFIPEGIKAKDVKTGYMMKLLSQSETEFTLAQDANFEGGIITIYYHFIRN